MKKKSMAILLIGVIFVIMMSSYFYMGMETTHHCIGEHCSICFKIKLCESIVKDVFSNGIFCATFVFFHRVLVYSWFNKEREDKSRTLVSLKVKLSN